MNGKSAAEKETSVRGLDDAVAALLDNGRRACEFDALWKNEMFG
jgi:hypothetical protein